MLESTLSEGMNAHRLLRMSDCMRGCTVNMLEERGRIAEYQTARTWNVVFRALDIFLKFSVACASTIFEVVDLRLLRKTIGRSLECTHCKAILGH